MMTENRKTYTAEFKHEAVRLVTKQGYSMSKTASSAHIYAWARLAFPC